MTSKIYTDKYSAQNLELGGNRASISAALCEKIIQLMSSAKESLNSGDHKGWDTNLVKVQEEVGGLISTIDDANLGEWGVQMQQVYLQISLNIYKLVAGDSEAPKVDDVLQQLFKVRTIWKELDAKYLQETQSSVPESGGWI